MKVDRLQKWMGRMGTGLASEIGKTTGKPIVRRAAFLLLRFVMGLLLSQAIVFKEYAPFGVGFVAAGGVGVSGLFGLLGALSGYMFLWDVSSGLKYIAISVLVFATGFVFQNTSAARKNLFPSLISLVSTAFVGVVFLAADGFTLTKTLLFATELILISGSAYFFKGALRRTGEQLPEEGVPASLKRLVSLLLLISCLFLSLSQITLFSYLSPARFVAMLLVMLLAYRGGIGAGSAVGLSIGAALDLATGTPFYAMTYGLTGLIGGAFQGTGKLACACVCVVVTAISTLWTGDGTLRLFVMLETFVASVLFMLVPDGALPALTLSPPKRAVEEMGMGRVRDHVRRRLKSSSAAFRELYESLMGTFSELSRTNDEDIATVFDRTSDRICKRCALVGVCWDREALATFHALSDTASAMIAHGSLEPTDFPPYFSARCMNFSRFVSVGNEELAALMYRRQYKARLRQSRMQLCQQYAELSRMLDALAGDVSENLTFDWPAEDQVGRYLQKRGIQGRVSVSVDSSHRTRVDIQAPDLTELYTERKKTVRDLSTMLGVRLGQPEQEKGPALERMSLVEAEPLAVSLGVAEHKKQGQSVSGDSNTYFKTEDGRLVVLLSDGMGSGREAALESRMAVRLLERFLRAGVQPETALGTLNSALVLRGEEQLGFVTIDLLIINLITGEAVFFKYGASPSYVKKGRKISRVASGALPVGLADTNTLPLLDVTKIKLGQGEVVLMVSDGVVDANADGWLQNTLSDWGEGTTRELAGQVLETGMREVGRGDDMTVMAVRVCRRRAQGDEQTEEVDAVC